MENQPSWTHSPENTESLVNPAIGKIYFKMLEAYGRQPRDGELDAWLIALGMYSEPDLDAGRRRWLADSQVEEYTGRPRGARMPLAAELKLSIEDFNRRERSIAAGKFIPCWSGDCRDGWIREFSGATAAGHTVDPQIGAVKRCNCFIEWAATRPRPEKPKIGRKK